METTIRVKLNGGRLKVIYRKGLQFDQVEALEKEWALARSLDDLRSIFLGWAQRTGQACTMIFESTRWNPMRLLTGLKSARRTG
jgi:hypothetical protein